MKLAQVALKRCNEVQKESDKIRKQFTKGEMNTEQFIKDYMKSRQKYYEHEVLRHSLASQLQ
jgi:Modifier of rudimentary (Mod(r)) protein